MAGSTFGPFRFDKYYLMHEKCNHVEQKVKDFCTEFLNDTTFWSQMFVRQEIHNVKQHIFVLKPEQPIQRRGAKSQNAWNHSHINN